MKRFALAFLALAALAPLAAARDDAATAFAKGLVAEHESGDPKTALAHYAEAQTSESPFAAAATLRRLHVYAALGDRESLARERAYLETFPGRVPKVELERKRPPLPSAWKKDYERTLAARRTTLNFQSQPLGEALQFLRDITGLNIVTTPKVELKRQVSLQLRDARLGDALAATLGKDLTTTLLGGAIVVHPAQAQALLPRPSLRGIAAEPELYLRLVGQRVSLSFEDAPLSEALDFFRDTAGLNFVSSGLTKSKISLRLKDVRLLEVLQHLALQSGAGFDLAHGAVHVGRGLSKVHARRVGEPRTRFDAAVVRDFRSSRLTLNQPGAPFGELVQFLRDITSANFHISGSGPELAKLSKAKVTLRLRQVSVLEALELIAGQVDVQARIHNGIVVFSKDSEALPKRLRRSEMKNAEIARGLRTRRVYWNLVENTLPEFLQFLREQTGWQVSAAEALLQGKKVSARFREVVLEDALGLTLAQVGLRYSVSETGLVIEAAE